MSGKISIIVPVYNANRFVRECFDSVLKQEYQNLEVILIDDGSTDDSGLICDEYSKIDGRFISIHTPNHGQGVARNIGLDRATGEYCFFLDPDDLIENFTLMYLTDLIEKYETEIVLGVSRNFVNDITKDTFDLIERNYYGKDEIIHNIIFDKRDLKPIHKKKEPSIVNYEFFSALYRMKLIKDKKLHFLDISYGEDTFFCFSYLLESKSATTTNQVVYWHRRNSLSTTFQYHNNYLKQTKIYYKEYRDLFAKKAPEYIQTCEEGLDAQYFFRCIAAIERELFIGVKGRTIRQMKQTIIEIRNDNKFKQKLTIKNIRFISNRKFRIIIKMIKLGLIFPVIVYAKCVQIRLKH